MVNSRLVPVNTEPAPNNIRPAPIISFSTAFNQVNICSTHKKNNVKCKKIMILQGGRRGWGTTLVLIFLFFLEKKGIFFFFQTYGYTDFVV